MAGASGLVRAPFVLAAEGALETTTVRIFANRPGICVAPQYIAEPLLQAEGFTDVRFVGLTATTGAPAAQAVGSGNADFTVTFAAPLAIAIDGGAPITLLCQSASGPSDAQARRRIRSFARSMHQSEPYRVSRRL
jgi:NitT/TauT family transport system substrate-binding protein